MLLIWESLVKYINILLTIKEHNEKNVTIIKHVYYARYAYRRSDQGHKTECNNKWCYFYIHWYKFNEGINMVIYILDTHKFNETIEFL